MGVSAFLSERFSDGIAWPGAEAEGRTEEAWLGSTAWEDNVVVEKFVGSG